VLVSPPLGLKLTTLELIKSKYNVDEQHKLKFSDLSFPTKGSKKNLAIVNSFDGAVAQSKQSSMSFVVYRVDEKTKGDDFAKNYYLEDEFQVEQKLREKLSAALIRTEVDQMVKDISKGVLKKLGSESVAKTEDDLLAALGVEAPKAKEPEQAKPQKKEKKVEEKKVAKKEEAAPAKKPAAKASAQKQEQSGSSTRGNIVVLVPIGIPGMGKTHFATE